MSAQAHAAGPAAAVAMLGGLIQQLGAASTVAPSLRDDQVQACARYLNSLTLRLRDRATHVGNPDAWLSQMRYGFLYG